MVKFTPVDPRPIHTRDLKAGDVFVEDTPTGKAVMLSISSAGGGLSLHNFGDYDVEDKLVTLVGRLKLEER